MDFSTSESEPYQSSGSEYDPNSSDESLSNGGLQLLMPLSTAIRDKSNSPSPSPVADLQNPMKGKKRCINKSNWKVNIRKQLRNTGQHYTTKSGKSVPDKVFSNTPCNCKQDCNKEITEHQRRKIFESFWKLADYSRQNCFIRGLVKANAIKRRRARDGSHTEKQVSFKYYLRVENTTHRVCKKYFAETLQISIGRLYRCVSKDEINSVTDQRGMNPKKKLDDSKIVEHIHSFPAYQSHYSRKDNPAKKYLNENLTISKMYEMYIEKCVAEEILPLKKKFYYHVFNTKFNLSFKPPAKDTCRICDELHMKILSEVDEAKNKLIAEKNLHLAKAEQARNSLRADQQNASEETYVATFDLQKALPFPKLSTSVAYYKKNLYVYNLGVHSFNEQTGFMYMYGETEGGRGAQDVASCLIKHLKTFAQKHKRIILYSDSCTGQNRNIKLSLSLLKLVQDPTMSVETIDHKFLVSGHSYLPNDADFGIIEKASRKSTLIYSPEDWMEIARNAKKKDPKFVVHEMKREDFLSTKKLEAAVQNRKKTVDGHPFSWLKIRWLRFEKSSPTSFKFKETLNETFDFYDVDLRKTSGGRPRQTLNNIQQDWLYQSRRIVTESKIQHMSDLLPFIPPIYHSYFRNLTRESRTRQNQTNNEESDSDNDEPVYVE